MSEKATSAVWSVPTQRISATTGKEDVPATTASASGAASSTATASGGPPARRTVSPHIHGAHGGLALQRPAACEASVRAEAR